MWPPASGQLRPGSLSKLAKQLCLVHDFHKHDDSGAAASQVTTLSEELSQLKARLATKRKEVSCHGQDSPHMGNALCYSVGLQR